MDIVKLRKELDYLYSEVSKSNFEGNYQVKEGMFKLINFNKMLLTELVTDKLTPEKVINTEYSLEQHFVDGVHEIINNGATLNVDILNWYRNLYYKEGSNTERGIMARVIGNLLSEMSIKNVKLSGLYTSELK